MIEHVRKQMMDHVVINDTVENMLADKAKVTVNGGQLAVTEVPAISLKVLRGRKRVVQVGDCNCSTLAST